MANCCKERVVDLFLVCCYDGICSATLATEVIHLLGGFVVLITLINILLFIVGISLIIWYKVDDCWYSDWKVITGCTLVIIFGAASVIMSCIAFDNSVNREANIKKYENKKITIEYMLSKQQEEGILDNSLLINGGDSSVYEQAVDFNYEVNLHQKLEDSIWTNWLYTQGVKDVGEIDLSKYCK